MITYSECDILRNCMRSHIMLFLRVDPNSFTIILSYLYIRWLVLNSGLKGNGWYAFLQGMPSHFLLVPLTQSTLNFHFLFVCQLFLIFNIKLSLSAHLIIISTQVQINRDFDKPLQLYCHWWFSQSTLLKHQYL